MSPVLDIYSVGLSDVEEVLRPVTILAEKDEFCRQERHDFAYLCDLLLYFSNDFLRASMLVSHSGHFLLVFVQVAVHPASLAFFLHLPLSCAHIFELLHVAQVLSLVYFELGHQFRPLLGHLLHLF